MLFTKLALGVDWSSSGLNLVALGRRFRRLVVVDSLHLSDPREDGVQKKVAQFLEKNRIAEARVTACLPREILFTRFLDLPAEAESQLVKVVNYQIDALHPFQGVPVYWDSAVAARDSKTRQIRVLVVIAERARLDAHEQVLKNLGLQVYSFSLTAPHLAPLLGASLPDTALVVIGRAKGLELLGFHRGSLCATRELSAETSASLADRLKLELHSLRSVLPLADPSTLPTFTCGRLPPSCAELFTEAKPIPVPKLHWVAPRDFDFQAQLPALAAAYAGLARKARHTINLLPAENRLEPSRWGRAPVYALGASASLMTLLLVAHGPIESASYGRALDRQVRQLSSQADSARRQLQEVARMSDRTALLEGLRGQTWRKLQILRELTLLLPDGTWVQEVQLGPDTVEVTGYSNRAAALIPPLEKSPYFSQVEFTSPITRDAQNREIFRIRLRLAKPANL